MITQKQIRKIIQDEIAGEVWYQDKGCEQRLEKCLIEAGKKLLSLISQDREEIVKEMEGESKRLFELFKNEPERFHDGLSIDWKLGFMNGFEKSGILLKEKVLNLIKPNTPPNAGE